MCIDHLDLGSTWISFIIMQNWLHIDIKCTCTHMYTAYYSCCTVKLLAALACSGRTLATSPSTRWWLESLMITRFSLIACLQQYSPSETCMYTCMTHSVSTAQCMVSELKPSTSGWTLPCDEWDEGQELTQCNRATQVDRGGIRLQAREQRMFVAWMRSGQSMEYYSCICYKKYITIKDNFYKSMVHIQ